MEVFICILLAASSCLLFIGIFNPKISLFWIKNNRKQTRKRSFAIYLTTIIFGLIILANSVNDEIKTTKNLQYDETIQYTKLRTPYYDSIYALKALPEIDLNKGPKIKMNVQLKKVDIKIYIKKKLNKEELKSIGIYYHDKYLVHPFNRVYVSYYTPEYTKEDAGCYATTHSNPNLEVYIMDAAKYWSK